MFWNLNPQPGSLLDINAIAMCMKKKQSKKSSKLQGSCLSIGAAFFGGALEAYL